MRLFRKPPAAADNPKTPEGIQRRISQLGGNELLDTIESTLSAAGHAVSNYRRRNTSTDRTGMMEAEMLLRQILPMMGEMLSRSEDNGWVPPVSVMRSVPDLLSNAGTVSSGQRVTPTDIAGRFDELVNTEASNLAAILKREGVTPDV